MNERFKEMKHGSKIFYDLIEQMAKIHDAKSHDYASNSTPYANYQFAGMLSKIFNNPDDSGFISRIGEKIYRLANLDNSGKIPSNESIEDTEIDICVIVALWMAYRKERRLSFTTKEVNYDYQELLTRNIYPNNESPIKGKK